MKQTPPIRIIVAEDDDADFDLLQMLFQEHFPDAELIRSKDGEHVIQSLTGSSLPHAVILDLNMPRKDGRQTLQEIKANKHWQDIPIIIFTTSNFSEDRELVKRLEGIYVNKSFSLNDSVEFVKQLSKALLTNDFSSMN